MRDPLPDAGWGIPAVLTDNGGDGQMRGQIRSDASNDQTDRIPWEERYLKWLFWAGAAGLAPWIVYLYLSQIQRAAVHHVRLLAVGLILAIVLGVLLTAWMCWEGRTLTVMAASFAATTAFVTAWFRTLTQTADPSWAGGMAVFLAIVVAIVVLCVIVIRSEFSEPPKTRARWLPIALIIIVLPLLPPLFIELGAMAPVQIGDRLQIAWTGLDVFEFLGLGATGFALHRRLTSAAVPAAVTGTLLVCDAWINVIPATGAARPEAIALAFVEVPLAGLSFWTAARAANWAGHYRQVRQKPHPSR